MKTTGFETIVNKMLTLPYANTKLINSFGSFVRTHYTGFTDIQPVKIYNTNYEAETLFSFGTSKVQESELQKRIEEAKKEETFSDMLIRLIREHNITSPQAYKAAGIDARHFSKINSNRDYKPSKETVLAFSIALHLSVAEANKLLETAGYTFSNAKIVDVTVQFFLENQIYDRVIIDDLMYKAGIPLLPQNF